MTSTRPRLLLLWMLPILGVALHRVHDLGQGSLYLMTKAAYGLAAMALLLFVYVAGPLVTAALFAYPLARLYSRHVLLAVGVVCVPVVVSGWSTDGIFEAMNFGQGVWLCLLVAVGAWFVRLRLGRSSLAIVASDSPAPNPGLLRGLTLSLLPLFAMSIFFIDLGFDILIRDPINARVPDTEPVRMIGWIFISVACAVLTALAFAYPVARVYGRRSALAAATLATPSAIAWSFKASAQLERYPWTAATYFTKAAAIVALLSLATWYLQRRLAGTRLTVVDPADAAVTQPIHSEPQAEPAA